MTKKILLTVAALVLLGVLYMQFGKAGQKSVNAALEETATDTASADVPFAEKIEPKVLSQSKPISDLRIDFERSDDLFSLARTHFNSNDPESSWLVAKIVDYCSPFGMDPKSYISNYQLMLPLIEPEARKFVLKAVHDRVISRCSGFDNPRRKETFGLNADLVLKRKAASAGSLAAEAALLSRNAPMATDAGYIEGLLSRVKASRDPDVFLAVSEAMSINSSGKEAVFGKNSGSNSSMYAWQLAACKIGLDCTPSGAVMTQYCSSGGICEIAPNLESLIFNHLVTKPEEAEIRRIMNEILSGTVNKN